MVGEDRRRMKAEGVAEQANDLIDGDDVIPTKRVDKARLFIYSCT